MQASETAHRNAVEMINRPCCDGDFHGHSTIHRFLRRARGRDFDVVITARLEVRLEASRNIGYTRLRVRPLQGTVPLSTERFCIVTPLSSTWADAKKILTTFPY